MNATYIALGAVFLALGAGAMKRARKSADFTSDTPAPSDTPATDTSSKKGARLSGSLFFVAGAIFIIIGVIGDR